MKIQHKGMIRDLLMGKHTGYYTGKEKETAAEKVEEKQEEITEPKQAEKPLELIEMKEVRREEDNHTLDAVTEEQRKQLSDSLDDILLTYIMKRAK